MPCLQNPLNHCHSERHATRVRGIRGDFSIITLLARIQREKGDTGKTPGTMDDALCDSILFRPFAIAGTKTYFTPPPKRHSMSRLIYGGLISRDFDADNTYGSFNDDVA